MHHTECNSLWDSAGRCSWSVTGVLVASGCATACGIQQVVAAGYGKPHRSLGCRVQLPVGFGRSLQQQDRAAEQEVGHRATTCGIWQVVAGLVIAVVARHAGCNYLWDSAGRCRRNQPRHRLPWQGVQLPVGFGRSLQEGQERVSGWQPAVQQPVGFGRSLQCGVNPTTPAPVVQLPVGFGRSLQWCNHLWELAG